MVIETITGEENLENVRKMFYREIAQLEKEQRRIDKIIKDRLYRIARTRYTGEYTQTIESNIKSYKKQI